MASNSFSPPWQSFVDCLSTVLLIMVFFSIVLVILVSVLSYSVSKKEMESERQSQQESKQVMESSETVTDNESFESGAPSISSLINTGEDRFIIYYDNLLAEAEPKVLEELEKWIQARDPSNQRNVNVIQEVIVENVSISDRRTVAFKRYYTLSRFIKNELGNTKVIKSFSVIKGEEQQNRAIVFFKE